MHIKEDLLCKLFVLEHHETFLLKYYVANFFHKRSSSFEGWKSISSSCRLGTSATIIELGVRFCKA
jgi:hypothetical protein